MPVAPFAVDVACVCHLYPTDRIVVERPGEAVHPIFFEFHFFLLAKQDPAKSSETTPRMNVSIDFFGKPRAAAELLLRAAAYGTSIIA